MKTGNQVGPRHISSPPVHESAVLEVITVSSDLQLPAGEAFPLIEGDLEEEVDTP